MDFDPLRATSFGLEDSYARGTSAGLSQLLGQSPLERMLFTGGLTFLATVYAKPAFAFAPSGKARPWVVTVAAEDPDAKNATAFPFWMPAVVVAAAVGALI